jgi:hypothetical protein
MSAPNCEKHNEIATKTQRHEETEITKIQNWIPASRDDKRGLKFPFIKKGQIGQGGAAICPKKSGGKSPLIHIRLIHVISSKKLRIPLKKNPPFERVSYF